MKITESGLRKIVSESLAGILNEMEIEKKKAINDGNASEEEKKIISVVRNVVKELERYGRGEKKGEYDKPTLELFGGLEDEPFYRDQYGTLVADIGGGWNGNGTWDTYFGSLEKFVEELARKEVKAWLIQMENDCLDDVYTASFGLKTISLNEMIDKAFESAKKKVLG